MFGLQKFLLLLVLTCFGQLVHGIIHGEKTPEGSMRYIVSVQKNGGHVCGGFLITNNFVVTAAHCIHDYPTHVALGNHNLKNGQTVEIEKQFVHNSYQSPETGDDIMLLQLATTNGLHDVIQLPHAEIDLTENEVCQVAGWGKTMSGGKNVGELMVVDVSVIDHQVCKDQWGSVPANVICAGGYGTSKGFCQGDSGGPLVCKGFAVGIVSFNYKRNCNYPDKPNVYTDISKYLQWIDKILQNHKALRVKTHMFCCLHY